MFWLLLLAFAMPTPPNLPAVQNYGCTLSQAKVRGADHFWWKLRVWADYQVAESRWETLYTEREGTSKGRSDALKDCDRYMRDMDKQLRSLKTPRMKGTDQ